MEKKFLNNLALVLSLFFLGFSDRASACETLADCEARKLVPPNTMTHSCCTCNPPDAFTPPYADENGCLCANGFLSYCGGSPAPPTTCASYGAMGLVKDTGGLCPGSGRCTVFTEAGKKCLCPVGQYWDVDECIVGVPPIIVIPPGCGVIPPASWDTHACGTGGTNCWDSEVPPPVPSGVTFSNLTNKMAACCGRGWGETTSASSQKLDCVETKLPAPGSFKSFLEFYNEGAIPNSLTTAGLSYPNQMFLLDKNNIPLNGFYDQSGHRCRYRDASTKAVKTLTAAQQMALFQTALTEMKPPSGGSPAEVDPLCCNLVVFALERTCPTISPVGGVKLTVTDSGTTRCTAAKEMKLDFAVIDLCDPSLVKRPRFRIATSYAGEDPTKASVVANAAITIQALIYQFYPPAIPLASPTCPESAALYEFPWSGGMCRLKSPEPPYSHYPSPEPT